MKKIFLLIFTFIFIFSCNNGSNLKETQSDKMTKEEKIKFEIMKVLEGEWIEKYTNNIRIKNFDPEMLNGRKNEEKKYIKGE